ncbi:MULTISPECIES: DUF6928 family protein [unclassified Streptomyces]|uniref:DUF6928 family protein n=1 Tax=unclassified Streptomyces TaxID=2593676 RepID=UPI0005253111|nr:MULTISPECIES: hypothetical protein [unclassified Streptomyces]
MGAKTGLLLYADGEAPERLRRAGAADHGRTAAMMRQLYPGWEIEEREGTSLPDGVYPPEGRVCAASWPGVEVIGDQRLMIDLPSRLPEHLVAASAGRRLVLHAMHSVVDWLAFAVWEDGRLVRSLSLSPDSGVMENIGQPLPFELPYWSGDRPADVMPWPDEEETPYPLPFHPLDLGEDALRALCGFVMEGLPAPDDVATDAIELHGFLVRTPDALAPTNQEVTPHGAAETMPTPRFYALDPDGTLTERPGLR